MFPRSFNTLLIVLTLMTAFSRQEGSGSGERMAAAAALSTIGGVLPTSISSPSSSFSFVTAIIRQTTGIQTTEEALASSPSSLPTIASVPPDYPPSSSSRLALSPSLRRSVNNNNNIDEKSPTSPTTQEVASLPKRWYRARMPGIWAQCDSYYSVSVLSFLPLFSLFFFPLFYFILFSSNFYLYIYKYRPQRVFKRKKKKRKEKKRNGDQAN